MSDKFLRYDDASRKVLTLAHEEVIHFNSDKIDTDHLLLGLLREDTSLAAKALYRLGLSVIAVRGLLEKKAKVDPLSITTTSALERVLYLAQEETDTYIRPEHLLLALASVYEGNGAIILKQFKITPEQITGRVKEYLN